MDVSLNRSKLFAELPPADLEPLERASELRAVKAGRSVFQEGDPGNGLYVILEGRVQIICLVSQDQRRVLSRLSAGEFFGEMAVLDDQPRSATAMAETDTQLVFVPRQALWDTLQRSPVFAARMMREFSLRLREFNHQYAKEVVQAERLTLVGRFARSIVHDFKNPLNIIGISADMLSMEGTAPEMREAARVRIRRQVQRMSTMIGELLEFTRGQGSAVVLARVEFGEFLGPLLDDLRPDLSAKSVTLVVEGALPSVRVLLDTSRIPHVFNNLMHNACEAMPGGGTITLRFRVTDDEVVTEVADTGGGIAAEIEPRLFEAFATHGKASGTGLGLSICKRIIEDHKGRISARNEGPGAVISFSLPLSKDGVVA
jgi:signal transduction histidine kinase